MQIDGIILLEIMFYNQDMQTYSLCSQREFLEYFNIKIVHSITKYSLITKRNAL